MSSIEVGMFVKDKTKKYSSVGMVSEILGDGSQAASVEFTNRYGRDKTYQVIKIENLIHVCNRNTGSGFESSLCGRPVKEGSLCGIHAAADRRVKENREREQKQWEESRQRREKLAKLKARMEERIEKLNITKFKVSVQDPATDTVTISLAVLEGLIGRDRNR